MKLILRIILIALFTYLCGFFLPWWGVAPIAAITCFLMVGSGIGAFVSGFLGGGIVWLFYAWYLDVKTQSIISLKIVQLFPFEDNTFLVLIAGLVGAFCGGFGALSGNSFKQLFLKKKLTSFYS